jgi:peptide/nickel transport system ATP-binding protein
MAMLKLEGLSLTLGGTRLLEDVSFIIGKGQRAGLIGRSGAGKSLLLRTILGLGPERAVLGGTISFDNAPMPRNERALSQLRGRRIGAVLANADAALSPLRTVGQHYADIRAGTGGGDVAALLHEAGLDAGLAERYPRDLTVAQRRCTALALALAPRPDLLVADDPTAGLDLIDQRRMLDLIDRQCRDRNMSLLLVSPDLKAIAMLCSRIVVLDAGKMVESGEKADVFGHPRHEVTRALLSAGRHRARTLMRTPIGGTLLEVNGLVRRFPQPDRSIVEPRPPLVALDHVSFALRAGESMAVLGRSGAGKSVLARLVVGLDTASSGELKLGETVYHGADLPRMLRREVGYVIADPVATFDPHQTVGESIAEPLQLEFQRSLDELGTRMVEVVTAVGLHPDVLSRRPGEFARAELQRLAIARALVTRPRLIVFDEPVAHLDVMARGETLVMLNRLRADFGLSFLLIGHDLDLMRVAADRVIVLDRGRVVEASTPAQLLEAPHEPISRQLVAAQLPDVGIVPVF